MLDYLIIKPGSLGDVIHSLPVAAAIKAARPEASLGWVIDDRWAPLLKGNPDIDKVAVFPRTQFRGLFGGLKSLPWLAGLKEMQAEQCLDLQGLLRSGIMTRMSRSKKIQGLSDAREGASLFYTSVTSINAAAHAVDRYLAILSPLGFKRPETLSFPLPEGEFPKGTPSEPFIVLHPYSRGEGKSLSSDVIRAFCEACAPTRVVLAGIGQSPVNLPANVSDLTGKTCLTEMVCLLRRATFVVSVDSGPMHIAAAVNRNLLSIHTWSDPRQVGPYAPEAWIWQGGSLRRQEIHASELPQPQTPSMQNAAEMAKHVISHLGS